MVKLRKSTPIRRSGPGGKPTWLVLVLLGVGLLLLGGGIGWGLNESFGQAPSFTPQANGPRLTVDQDTIDLGVQPLDRYVSATFQVKNVGDATLRIQEEPYVELVEGC
ncbi:MAG: hypothetical protein H8E35_05665 [Ardenticatenia bacterium]|nr:hypothetical protein [Ardenticatenia bacterium]